MMGAGGFIKNPGWDMYSDDLVDEDDVLYEVNSDLDIDPELLVYFPPWSDDDLDTDEELVDPDDPDYENSDLSDSPDDFDDDDDEELDNSMEEDEEVDQMEEEDEDSSSLERFKGFPDMAEEESENDST